MPQSGLYGFPTDAIVLNQIFDSGSGLFKKPQGLIGKHTVIVRTWGGGGGGDNAPVGGGGGGGFNQRAFPYEDFPTSAPYTVGAGGIAPSGNGGDSYVTGDGVDVAATGGGGSTGGAGAGGKAAFRYGTATSYPFDFAPYNGGIGGDMAIWGGAGGSFTVTFVQPQSIYGGSGPWFDGGTQYPGSAPGGGGSYYYGGDGYGGRVQFIIVRGIFPDLMGNLF